MDLTILIPTKDRVEYLIRLLDYYADLNFKGKIIILDASNDLNFNKIDKKINNIDVSIKHIKSNLTPLLSIRHNLSEIDTSYVTSMGDDDYLIPSGIEKSISILKNDKSIIACHGKGLIIPDPKFNKNDTIEEVGKYPGPNQIEDSIAKRLLNYFSNYKTPFFSVFKTNIFKEAFKLSPSKDELYLCPDRLISDELLVAGLLVLKGKIASYDFLHIIRGHHPKRKIDKDNWSKITTKADTIKSINFLVDLFYKELADFEKIKPNFKDELTKIIKIFIYNYHHKKNKITLYQKFKKILKLLLANIGILAFLLNFKNYYFNKGTLSLQNLLKSDHKYHNDFIRVYKSILKD